MVDATPPSCSDGRCPLKLRRSARTVGLLWCGVRCVGYRLKVLPRTTARGRCPWGSIGRARWSSLAPLAIPPAHQFDQITVLSVAPLVAEAIHEEFKTDLCHSSTIRLTGGSNFNSPNKWGVLIVTGDVMVLRLPIHVAKCTNDRAQTANFAHAELM